MRVYDVHNLQLSVVFSIKGVVWCFGISTSLINTEDWYLGLFLFLISFSV